MIESTLYTRLSTYSGLTALVSTRIYPLVCPQGVTYPAVVYQRISTMAREVAMGSDPGIVRARVQVTAWADNYTSAKAVADKVRLALERYRTTGLFDIYIIGENDLYDEEALKYGVAVDAKVVYLEATT